MNTETKVCIRCGEEKPIDNFKFSWNSDKRKNQCSTCYSRWYTSKRKLDFLEAFDWKCSCCGESHPQFLTLDHKNGGGNQHRQVKACHEIVNEARREGFDRSKWDCLCMNCNFAKGHYGVCPHHSGVTPEQYIEVLRAQGAKVSRKHVQPKTRFTGGFDERRMQLNLRVLKPCPYCGKEFGTNEMVRHKRSEHARKFPEGEYAGTL